MDLPIFHDNLRSSGGWAAELERAHKDWIAASLDVRSRVREHQVREGELRMGATGTDGRGYRRAAELVSSWSAHPNANLDLDRISQINVTLRDGEGHAGQFRTNDDCRLGPFHDPAPAVILPRLVDNALDWFQAQSFSEIHAVEQAAIVLLRVNDLQPFELLNGETAILSASFFVERATLPPLIIQSDEATMTEYKVALEAAFRMLTQPLVEFLSRSLVRTVELSRV